jgi:hypothetical protein
MSETAIFDTTMALRRRIKQATGAASVHVGPPLRGEMGDATIALFLFHIQPSAELRNTPRFASPPAGPATGPAVAIDAIPLELRYLIVCYRGENQGGNSGPEPGELETLGTIIANLHGDPILSGAALSGQQVALTPDPASMDDMNRIWGLIPDEPLRTSIVYLAAPVFIELRDLTRHPPVVSRRLDAGLAAGDRNGA